MPWSTFSSALLDRIQRGAATGICSLVALLEILVKPLRRQRPDVAQNYQVVLSAFPHLQIVPVGAEEVRVAAELRAAYRLRVADAIQLATAAVQGATCFVTNDRALTRVDTVKVLVLDDFVAQ